MVNLNLRYSAGRWFVSPVSSGWGWLEGWAHSGLFTTAHTYVLSSIVVSGKMKLDGSIQETLGGSFKPRSPRALLLPSSIGQESHKDQPRFKVRKCLLVLAC